MSLLRAVKPTRADLNNLKKDEIFIQKAVSLLDEKLIVLTIKVKEFIKKANELKKDLDKKIVKALNALSVANMEMGLDAVDQIADTCRRNVRIKIREVSFMGVVVPEIEINESKIELPDFGIFRTSIYLDKAQKLFSEVLKIVIELSAIENSAYRLLLELKKTQKRLNALEYILIPDYDKTIKFIENSLEESEREDIVAMKIIKDYLLKKSNR